MEPLPPLPPGQDFPLPFKPIEIGLSWEMVGHKIDLDLSALLLTTTGQLIDSVFYNKTSSDDNSVVHSGDERSGKREGYDEKININPELIAPATGIIAILVNSPEEGFQRVETAELAIFIDNKPIIVLNCGWKGDYHAILSCLIYRDEGTNGWKIRNISETGNQKNFVDCLPLVISNLNFLQDEDTLKEAAAWNIATGKSINLKKGAGLPLPDFLEDIAMGLGWETKCDLDSAVLSVSKSWSVQDTIYFGRKTNENYSIEHMGDNTTGDGEGDDENIVIHLKKLNKNIHYLFCLIKVYTTGQNFNSVTQAYCRLFDWKSQKEFCKYILNESGNNRMCLMCYLQKDIETEKWSVKATGEFFEDYNYGADLQLIEFVKKDSGQKEKEEKQKLTLLEPRAKKKAIDDEVVKGTCKVVLPHEDVKGSCCGIF